MGAALIDEEDVPLGVGSNGQLDLEFARALGLLPASFPLRSLAFIIDSFIVFLLALPLALGTFPRWLNLALSDVSLWSQNLFDNDEFVTGLIFYGIGQGVLSIFLLIQLLMHGRRGVTVGKAMVGIRSVNASTFAKPGFWRIFLRAFVFWLSLVVIPVVGAVVFLLSPLWDSERRGRGWLDRIGGNWLIDVRRGLDPFDSKALRHARKRLTVVEKPPEAGLPSLATGAGGAIPSFVPISRSRSGVVSAPDFGDDRAGEHQTLPPVVSAQVPITPQHVSVQFVFDDGRRINILGDGLMGRAPEVRIGEEHFLLVPVVDESRRISKTHIAFGVDGGGFWVVDRGSSNGTFVTFPGAGSFQLVPWERRNIPWQSVVEVGGRSFSVVKGEVGR